MRDVRVARRLARLVADLEEQLHVQLVGQLQRADRVTGLRRRLLDGRRARCPRRAWPPPR